MDIEAYKNAHGTAVMAALKEAPGWEMFTEGDAADRYVTALERSVTYVCHDRDEFCGYVRAVKDDGFFIYISELYVLPEWRGRSVGRSLLKRVKEDYLDLAVYVLSDEDEYYEHMGFKKAGSVFEL